jgi:hypothetical protein
MYIQQYPLLFVYFVGIIQNIPGKYLSPCSVEGKISADDVLWWKNYLKRRKEKERKSTD